MCGIAAIYGGLNDVDLERLRRATAILRHRGPDASGHYVSPRGTIGLGHARLSIIDLQTGDQPLTNEDGSLHAIVNGEFYDFERIRESLILQGHRFQTHTDSEILLHLYEDYGASCLRFLRGEFAFVLWDEPHQRLFAARDRFGIKPLYYAWHEGSLYLASEVKALFAAGVPALWDYDMLVTGPLPDPDRTLFAGVHQVPPAHYLLANRDHVDMHPYWDFPYPRLDEERPRRAPEDDIEELRARLHDAVRLRLRADVPVACYLSGGLDSCAALGIAAHYSDRPIAAYTLSFDHADYDERATAEAQASLSGASFHPIEIRSEHLAEHFADALWHAERTFINPHCVAKFLLSRAVNRDGIKVVLTGEGSDEIFAGYPHFRKDLVLFEEANQQNGDAAGVLDALNASNRVSQGLLLAASGSPHLKSVHRVLGYTPSFLDAQAHIRTTSDDLLTDGSRRHLEQRDPFRSWLDHLDVGGRLAGRHPVNQSLYLWSKTLLPNYILSNLGDRMEMAHSVEGRLPFLDHEVVECAARLPVEMKIHEMTEKYVLREAARPVLTDEVYRRQKHPFLSPPATLQPDGALYTLVQDTLRGASVAEMGVFDADRLRATLDRLPAMEDRERLRYDPILMHILSLCLLHERFSLSL